MPSFDVAALSGILGSISIACWIVVFSPQILLNFLRSSADGLSTLFILIWLSGDVCNVIGAVLQGVLPTMLILAVYYAFCDIILLGQCLFYRHRNAVRESEEVIEDGNEDRPLLSRRISDEPPVQHDISREASTTRSTRSLVSLSEGYGTNGPDATHLNPANPLFPDYVKDGDVASESSSATPVKPLWRTVLINTGALILVCAAGVAGYFLTEALSQQRRSGSQHHHHHRQSSQVEFDPVGQAFGYACAVLYLGSRIPQLLLNYRRKSTEGISFLFFLFACVGNATYVGSIFAYDPVCISRTSPSDLVSVLARRVCTEDEWNEAYSKWIAVNTSWLIGSAGTLLLDLLVFVQFWMYKGNKAKVHTTSG